jgi:hypothetical protein
MTFHGVAFRPCQRRRELANVVINLPRRLRLREGAPTGGVRQGGPRPRQKMPNIRRIHGEEGRNASARTSSVA